MVPVSSPFGKSESRHEGQIDDLEHQETVVGILNGSSDVESVPSIDDYLPLLARLLPLIQCFLRGDETASSERLLDWMNHHASSQHATHPTDNSNLEMTDTRSKSRSSSPEVPLAATRRVLVPPTESFAVSSSDDSKSDQVDQLASDSPDEGNIGPPSAPSNAIQIGCVSGVSTSPTEVAANRKAVIPAHGNMKESKGKKARKLKTTKADTLYDSDVHKCWDVPVSQNRLLSSSFLAS